MTRGRRGATGPATGTAGRMLAVGGVAGGLPALVYVGAPWGIILAVVVAALLLGLVQAVFPQESQHRLDWWRDRRHRRTPTQPQIKRVSSSDGPRRRR